MINYIAIIIIIAGNSNANSHNIYACDLTDTEIYSQVGLHAFKSENHEYAKSPVEYLDPVSIHRHNTNSTEQTENVCMPPPHLSEESMDTYAIIEPWIQQQPCQQQLEGREEEKEKEEKKEEKREEEEKEEEGKVVEMKMWEQVGGGDESQQQPGKVICLPFFLSV